MNNKVSYTESCGEELFNWNLFFNQITYTQAELKQAEDFANRWTTCACGQQCAVIPRWSWDGSPMDGKLRELGMEFYNDIQSMRDAENMNELMKYKLNAMEVLHLIEVRSAEIIAKYHARNN